MKKNLPIYIIIILHAVGIAGTLVPATAALTISLTPVNLLISSLLLIYLSPNPKVYLFLVTSFIIGMASEIVGVQTGWPFGSYSYGTVLGFHLMEVPIIIGINWFMLTYASGVIAHKIFTNSFLAILFGATLMVTIDLLIEPVAIQLGYWDWGNSAIPVSNYIAWWVISVLILLIFNRLLRNEKNLLVIPLIISQLAYFISILLFS